MLIDVSTLCSMFNITLSYNPLFFGGSVMAYSKHPDIILKVQRIEAEVITGPRPHHLGYVNILHNIQLLCLTNSDPSSTIM